MTRHQKTSRAAVGILSSVSALLVLTAFVTDARSYNRYNDGCQTCHMHFDNTDPYMPPGGGAAWPDDLHRIHRHNSWMATACNLCHTTGDGDNPYIGSSDGTANNTGYGCTGCHGRDYGGTVGVSGVGLRAHHAANSVTSCAGCHTTDPAPLTENVVPPYYGTADTDVNVPCNDDAGLSEDWSGDGVGLDNDGDNVYDANDSDCSGGLCGNGIVDSGELCDPCPTSCDDSDTCTADTMTGSPATCDVVCTNTAITACTDNDGCCPTGCSNLTDNDCAPVCGNGVIEAGETCDPPGACPTSCDDSNACTTDTLTGTAANCDAACSNTAITACQNGDGCCPAGCDNGNDDDCSATCGDGTLDPGETCDPPSSCPTDCDDSDACTTDTLTGSAANCNAACSNVAVTACADGDGCCPAGCVNATDNDCTCGDGVLDPGETCDPPSSCPTSCDDSDACTADTLTGSAATCDATCTNDPITSCTDGDGCCAAGCTAANDNDCGGGACGNGVLDPGETCDPTSTCPTSCDDLVACTTDTMTGSADTCDVVCENVEIITCIDDDGCCPWECSSSTDSDCGPGTADDSGCGCRSGADDSPLGALLFGLLLLLGLLVSRRRTGKMD